MAPAIRFVGYARDENNYPIVVEIAEKTTDHLVHTKHPEKNLGVLIGRTAQDIIHRCGPLDRLTIEFLGA